MGLSPNSTLEATFTLEELRRIRDRDCGCKDCKCKDCKCDDMHEASMVERQFKAAKDEGLVVEQR